MSQIIEITVTPEGNSSIQTHGFAGPSCQEASLFLEETLGRRTGQRRTEEFYGTQITEQRHDQRN